ncbi:MAG TPA: hypothetical protein VG759_19120 [Candidatus Angelobacter sp.]|nr:hypothetical protein [Candidatus Angelobacter sp.]
MRILIVFPLLLLSFKPGVGKRGHHQKLTEAQRTSYCDLIAGAPSFFDKTIEVRGIYAYGFEVQSLLPPACCPASGTKPLRFPARA